MATSTLYPSSDGYISHTASTYSGVRTATAGTSVVSSSSIIAYMIRTSGSSYTVYRGFLVFSLSGITPSSITGLSCSVKCTYAYGNPLDSNTGFGQSYCWVSMVSFTPANVASVAVGDYDQMGVYALQDSYSVSATTWYTWTFTGTALTNLKNAAGSNGGYVCLGIRELNHDMDTYGGGWLYSSNGQFNQANFSDVESSDDPYLTVTYPDPPSAPETPRVRPTIRLQATSRATTW